MKKSIFLGLATFAMLLTTSCVNEIAPSKEIGDTPVTFQIGTPEIATRAYSDGTTATKLQYAVYDEGGNLLDALTVEDAEINGSTSIELQLVTGNEYSIIFWAAAPNAPYTIDFANKTMTVNYQGAVCNDETRDAFYKCHTFTVRGAQTETIELKRPFAQLNIGTGDYTASKNAGYVPTTSAVTVKNIYKTLSLVDGVVTDETEAVFAANAIPEGEQFPVAGYEYLAMNYLLVNTEKEVVDVEFTYADASNDAKTRTVGSVPVQRNYRTNIYGQLLTSDVDINVEIKPEYENDDKYGAIDGQVYVKVSNALEFNEAFVDENVDIIILTEDIVLDESLTRAGVDPELVVSKGKAVTIDLAGNKLSSTSTGTGKNYNMFDVRGTMTVKNGTMEYEHKGDNMGWSNSTNLFNVTDGGVLNIEGVTAKNLGGSDMAFVAHLNNWGEVTLNVKNSVLESPYIAVRVFNSGNDMNNVTIKGSTLKGTRSFWVHNYTVADFGTQEKADAHKALLNFDIFNDQANPSSDDNTFIYDEENKLGPVCYGFTNDIYFDQYGNEISQYIPIIENGVEVGAAYDPASATEVGGETVYTTIVVTEDKGMAWVAEKVGYYEGFAGKTIKLDTDIDLAKGYMEDGEPVTTPPIGDKSACKEDVAFKGTFDGQGHSIKNLYQSGWALNYEWGVYGSLGLFRELENATVKNVVIEDMEARVEGGDISFIAGSATGNCVFENITIKNSTIGTYNNGCGGIIGWSGAGNYTFKNITLAEDVVLGGMWGSFDSSIGGIVGQAEPGATYNFENVTINCRIDAYNDCTASYDYYNYRMCGMIIGRCEETTTIDGTNYPDLSKYNLTFNNVVVNYGDWMNYHYCDPTPGHNSGRGMRVEPGYAYDGLPADYNHSQCTTHHYECIPFNQLIGGAQYGVKGLPEVEGVTVNYPAEYTCSLCGKKHNATSNE